jgi:hypothetical protein
MVILIEVIMTINILYFYMVQIIRASCAIAILTVAGNLHAMKRELEHAETPATKRFHSNENYYDLIFFPPFAFANLSDFPNANEEAFNFWYKNRLDDKSFYLSDLKEFISLKDIIQRVQNSGLDNNFPPGDPVEHRASLVISAIEKAAAKQNDEALNLLTVAAINGSWIATSFFSYLKRSGNKNESADTMPIREYLSEAINFDWLLAVDFATWNDPNGEKGQESVICPYYRETLLVAPHWVKLRFTWGDYADVPIFLHLLSYISKSTKLRKLEIGGWVAFENDNGERLASSLAKLKDLRKLRFNSTCEFSEPAFAALALSLQNLNLKTLNMQGCLPGPQSIMSLSCALQLNTSLRSLDLSSNSLGDEGILHLKEALVPNITLERLALLEIDITATGFDILANLLKDHPTLTSLELGQEKFVEDGALSALRDAVLALPQLKEFAFTFTRDIPESFIFQLSEQLRALGIYSYYKDRKGETAQYLAGNVILRILSLGVINVDYAEQLLAALKQNDILIYCNFGFKDEVPFKKQMELGQEIEQEITKNQQIEEIRRSLTPQLFYKEPKLANAQEATLLVYLALKLDDNSFPGLVGLPHELLREIFSIVVALEIQAIKYPPAALPTTAAWPITLNAPYYNYLILNPGELQMPIQAMQPITYPPAALAIPAWPITQNVPSYNYQNLNLGQWQMATPNVPFYNYQNLNPDELEMAIQEAIQAVEIPPTVLPTPACTTTQNTSFYDYEILDLCEWKMPTEEEFLSTLEQ